MTTERFSGFLTPLEKRYLKFLEYKILNQIEYDNRKDWDKEEKMPHRSLDFQIRWKTREALEDLRLVFEKFGYMELQSFFNDVEVLNNIKFLNETVEFVKAQRETRRLERETG